MVKSRPYVIISGAISIDGKIATRTGRSNLSSRADLIRIHKLRKTVDAILVGRNTINTDNPQLTVRLVTGRNPMRVIMDPKGKIHPDSRVVKTARKISTVVVVLESASRNMNKFTERGLEIIKCGKNKIDLKKLLWILKRKGVNRLLVEGGGITNWYFIKEKLVDEMVITVTPYVLGGDTSISLVGGVGFKEIATSHSLKLRKIEKVKNEVILHYIS
jgi:2,5-diamino-6-(ribosylamino)-4(3H)-pyrimidinone 5'-phosphate reductase